MNVRVAVVLIFGIVSFVAAPRVVTSAEAHAGARAQLFVASARVEPRAQGFEIHASLRDLDSGAPQPGFEVQVKGAGPSGAGFEPIVLVDPHNAGEYEGVLPVSAGTWALTVEACEIPGGKAALPFSRTWNVSLQPGQAIELGGMHPAVHGERNSASVGRGLVLGLVGVAVLLVIASRWFGHRRGSVVPVR